MKLPEAVIRRPVVTEKGTRLREEANQYLFEVALDANKVDITRAVEQLFQVHVTGVRTVTVRGKVKKLGRFVGRTASWKKAVVTLKAGESIELFEGA